MQKTVDKLIEKSKEAFILAVEIYNKPTIKYRVEGFAFFICNAWELMLKAHLLNIKGESAIYYRDNPTRTINLENCLRLIFTNDKTPLRQNLERIIELRNTSTHFITEEYEMVYVPLFQSCIFNFSEKMQQFHEIDVTELISLNFLNLVVKEKSLDENEVKAKYDGKIADKLLGLNNKIAQSMHEANDSYAIRIEHSYRLTKNKNEAADVVAISSDAETAIQIVKEIKDPNDTHKYTAKKVYAQITDRIKRNKLTVLFRGVEVDKFNQHHFQLFCGYYKIKENEKWCFIYKPHLSPSYTYSMQLIEFIFDEIKKDPENILDVIKERLKSKKLTPGA